MKSYLLLRAAALSLAVAAPALAQTSVRGTNSENTDDSTATATRTIRKEGGGAAPGAASGAVAGAIVAGPIGAILGGITGATLGHTVAPPAEVRTYVTTQDLAPVTYAGAIEVGKAIDGEVVWREVPSYPKYHWAYLNDQRVVVDDRHNVVALYTH